ncbi:hypothetical protein [Microbacterium sp. VKM Ac-2923]|uniref:hypothetical protein n=1 Tax=Microbacterium sp. VKM Ac-2923 TaxID=2929476 RepID=UPI001FB28DF7|nr:hypothetical protein [Microbacterium sp. VKM Ac-2923]MCJ1707110.1 hypothetical protein [Microbacterium sp. VKM Ac-2923]
MSTYIASGQGAVTITGLITFIWASMAVAGVYLGPAVHPPFLAFATAGSELPRTKVFRRPLSIAFALVGAAFVVAAGACGAALIFSGAWSPLRASLFVVAGLFSGMVAAVLWLAGQWSTRVAIGASAGLVAEYALSLVAPAFSSALPSAWVGYVALGEGGPAPLLALAVVSAALLLAVPRLLTLLTVEGVLEQCFRRDATISNAAALQLAEVSALYQAKPTRGRHRRAVLRSRSTPLRFFVVDLVGAMRTPGRVLAGALFAIVGGILLAVAVTTGGGLASLSGGVGGVVLYAALGPFTDGVRHACATVSERSLYGIHDVKLLLAHVTMPLVMALCLLTIGVVTAFPLLVALTISDIASVYLTGFIALVLRINGALKGPLPLSYLAAVPTPFGDPMAIIRVAWAVDGLLIVSTAGFLAADESVSPIILMAILATVVLIGVYRWRRREY